MISVAISAVFPIFLAAMVALAFSFPIEDEDKMDL